MFFLQYIFFFYKNRKQSMQQLKRNLSQMHKRLVLNNERRSLYKLEKPISDKMQKQSHNPYLQKDKEYESTLKIFSLHHQKIDSVTTNDYQFIKKERHIKISQNLDLRGLFAQAEQKKQAFIKRKVHSQTTHSKAKSNEQQFCFQQGQKKYNEPINEIINKLSETLFLQIKCKTVTIKKDKLLNIWNSLLQYISTDQHNAQHFNSIAFLKPSFKKVKKGIDKTRISQKQQKMTFLSNIVKHKISSHDTQKQLQSITYKLALARKDKDKLQDQIEGLKRYNANFTKEWKQKQQEMKEWYTKIQQIRKQHSIQENKLIQFKKEVQYQELILLQNKRKVQNLVNFVQRQQEKKILHWVSEAYKKIEGEIYDYATYLQCNAMASSLTWQPKPFRAVEDWIDQEMQRVTKFIMSKAEDQEQKSKRMKEFVLSTLRKFKAKDEQMLKITDFKTSSIRKFIEMMQKWMENWELKQEYLVNLRQQFVVEEEKINEILKSLMQNTEKIDIVECKFTLLQELKTNWQKVVLNYSYGNSFY